MQRDEIDRLLKDAKVILKQNDKGKWTAPAIDLYPHQWLWDSCFIAIGLRHISVDRAMAELRSLVRGQWSNGMLPNIIFSADKQYRRDRNLWRSWVSPYAPSAVATSGITQPPMLAEAVEAVGAKLRPPERRSWFCEMYPALLAYHNWIYRERDPRGEGLAVLVHPYESGMDSSPVWTSELNKHGMVWWIKLAKVLRLDSLASTFRRDTRSVPAKQRMDNLQAMAYWGAMLRQRAKAYNSQAILHHPLFAIEDLCFNSCLVRANECLADISKTIGRRLPKTLQANIDKSASALQQLWDENSGQYFSRHFMANKFIEVPTVSTLLPLYATRLPNDRVERLRGLLNSNQEYGAPWPIPTLPLKDPGFDANRYWQGPSWVNINWLVIKGLERNGLTEEASELRQRTLQTVLKSGMNEYFNPRNGAPLGVPNFSWTAALTIDLLKS